MSGAKRKREPKRVSELVALIDAYKDTVGGPSDASVGRAIGVARQTISSWRRRGISDLPERASLIALADLIGVDYATVVLPAVLRDTGYLTDPPEPEITDDVG